MSFFWIHLCCTVKYDVCGCVFIQFPTIILEALMIISFSQLIFSSYMIEGKTKYFLPRLPWYIICYSQVNLLFHDTGLDSGVQWLQMLLSSQGMC
jgi:hypothetical protein